MQAQLPRAPRRGACAPPTATSPTRPTGSTAAGPRSASPRTRRAAATTGVPIDTLQGGRPAHHRHPAGLQRPQDHPAPAAAPPRDGGDRHRHRLVDGRAPGVRHAAQRGLPRAPVGPGQRARHLLAAPLRADRPGDRAPLHAAQVRVAGPGPLRGHQLDAVGGGGARLRVRLHAGRAQRARHVGGAVRRLRQRRAGGVRPVHLLGRAQVAAHVGPRLPAAARLRGAGPGALLGAARALPADCAPRTTGRSPTARRPPTTSTSCAASCTASSASR